MNAAIRFWQRLLLLCGAGLLGTSQAWAELPPNTLVPPAFRGNPTGLIWVVALVGFATAALVQWANDFLHMRRDFHRRTIRGWLKRRVKRYNSRTLFGLGDLEEKMEQTINDEEALSELEALLGAESNTTEWPTSSRELERLPVYSLQTEQLCGQISAAAEVAVSAPSTYKALFIALSYTGRPSFRDEINEYTRLCSERAKSEKIDPLMEQRYGELRAQFTVQIQRILDALQISTGEQWRTELMMTCATVSCLFSFITVAWLYKSDATRDEKTILEFLMTFMVIALAGALAAPVAHDLMRAIRSFRRS